MRIKSLFSKLLLIILLLTSAYIIYNQYTEKVDAKAKDSSIINIKDYEDKTININDLRDEYGNNEITGVLNIPNEDLSVIVTKTSDNNKYLTTNIYGQRDVRGNPFMDYRDDIENSLSILIYGHNSDTYDVPFKKLENYYEKDYYDDHPYIELITEKGLWRYKIFSVYVETSDWYYLNIDFDNKDDWLAHLEKLKSKSIYDTGENISPDDNILILQTCSFKKEYENFNKKYLLIIARRVY